LTALQLNREIGNIKQALAGLPVITGFDDPEGDVASTVGGLFLRVQGTTGRVYLKQTGEGTKTGWVELVPQARHFSQGWVSNGIQSVDLGDMPDNSFVFDINVHVIEAFNSDGTDLLTVGWDADPDALMTSLNVSSTGVKVVAYGVSLGFNSRGRTLKAFYSNGGSEPTTGKALIVVEHGVVDEEIG
jgi:hypothetical protein